MDNLDLSTGIDREFELLKQGLNGYIVMEISNEQEIFVNGLVFNPTLI